MDALTKPRSKAKIARGRAYPDLHDHVRALDSGWAADHGRSADQQGHRDAPAGALAVSRRHRGEGSQGVPVHQRHRQQGPQIRHSGAGRRRLPPTGKSIASASAVRSRRSTRAGWTRARKTRSRRASSTMRRAMRSSSPARPRQARQRARRHSAADLDAGLGHRALRDAVAIHHQGSRHRHPEHGQLPRPGESAAAARHESVAGAAARHLQSLGKAARARLQETAMRGGARRAALHHLRVGAEAAGNAGRTACRRRAGRRADQRGQGQDRRPAGAGRSRDRDRGLHRHRISRAGGAVRRIARPRQFAGIQRLHGRDRDHAPARRYSHLDHLPGDAVANRA